MTFFEGVSNTAALVRFECIVGNVQHSDHRKKNTVIAQGDIGELAGVRLHGATDSTVGRLVELVLTHKKLRYARLYVTEHISLPSSNYYTTLAGIFVTPWVLQEPMEDVVSTANDPEFLQTMQDRLLDRVLETDVQ